MATDGLNRDEIKYALTQTMAFYDKELTDVQWNFWWAALKHLPHKNCMRALKDYVGEGKYAPRPAHIVEITNRYPKEGYGAHSSKEPEREEVKCPESIREAWQWYISLQSKGSALEGIFGHTNYTAEQEEKMLHIVNEQAATYKQPEAISAEHKLREYWGGRIS